MELGPEQPRAGRPTPARCKPWSAACRGALARTAATWCGPAGGFRALRLRPSHPVSQWFWRKPLQLLSRSKPQSVMAQNCEFREACCLLETRHAPRPHTLSLVARHRADAPSRAALPRSIWPGGGEQARLTWSRRRSSSAPRPRRRAHRLAALVHYPLAARPLYASRAGSWSFAWHQGPSAHRGQHQCHCRVPAAASGELLPGALARSRISLEDLTSAEVQAAVAEGRADVGVFTAPLLDNRLQTWIFGRPPLGPGATAPPLASRDTVTYDDLCPVTWSVCMPAPQPELLRERLPHATDALNARAVCGALMASRNWSRAGRRRGPCCHPGAGRAVNSASSACAASALKNRGRSRDLFTWACWRQRRLPTVVQRFVDTFDSS